MAGQAAPATPEADGFVDQGLLAALDAVAPTVPAAISDDLGTVVAQNSVSVALFGQMAGRGLCTANIVWLWFTKPEWRLWLEPVEQHTATSRAYVADLRAVIARRSDDLRALAFVKALREASTDFGARWDEHPVSALHCVRKRIDDARVGVLELDCAVMLSPLSNQRLMLLHPAPGTDASSRLARLYTMASA